VIFPLRPRRIEEPELVVSWNGTMAGGGARPSTPAPELPPADRFSRYDVLAVLRQRGPLTMREIADALDTTLTRVNALLWSLLQAGHVVADETTTRKRYGGQLRRYRVVTSPILDVGRARGAHARVDVTPGTPESREEPREQAVDRRRAHPKPRASRRTE